MQQILKTVNSFVWGIPALILILGIGLYLTIKTGFAQFRLLPRSFGAFFGKGDREGNENGISSFQALCTALAATVGTGNIAGVAGAIALGGPGSIFWMWICALLGMITKFAEATLAVRFQKKDHNGNLIGGPMYIIEAGMGRSWHWLAVIYCMFGVIAALGVGNATQINAVVTGFNEAAAFFGGNTSETGNVVIAAIFAALTAMILLGGAKRIGGIAELLVPIASAAYLALGLGALLYHIQSIPQALCSIVTGAFQPRAVTGGMLGSAFHALRIGAARGVFTNEAGMGTAAIAHGSSGVRHPAQQGLMGIMEVFLDTIVICTMTALVILTSGVTIPYGTDEGALLTTKAFACTYGQWISIPIALFLCCFAFATMIGWGLYGLRCAQYLFGQHHDRFFVIILSAAAIVSALLKTGTVWLLAETVNGLMALPNLIALAVLSPVTVELTHSFIQAEHQKPASGKNPPKARKSRPAHCRGHGSRGSFHR